MPFIQAIIIKNKFPHLQLILTDFDKGSIRVHQDLEFFKKLECNIDVYDPWVDKDEALTEYNIKLIEFPEKDKYDAIVLAVAHDQFQNFSLNEIVAFGKDIHVIYDIKYLLKIDEVDGRL